MKLSRVFAVLALASLGCVGAIAGDGNKNPPPPGGPQPPPNTPPNNPPPVNVGMCTAQTLSTPRAWRLTEQQMKNTLLDALNFSPPTIDTLPGETRLEGFANQSDQLAIAPLVADYYFKAGDELGGEIIRRATEFIKCPVNTLAAGTCLTDFIKSFGLKMWRRPLADAEVAKLSTLFTTTSAMAGGSSAGVKNLAQAFFMSPNFLFRSEVGNTQAAGQTTYLTDYELASALSYMLWDSGPDQMLLDLAAQGKLHEQATIKAQAMRLWNAPRKAPSALHSFLQQWLQIENLLTADKDPMAFSVYSMQVAVDLLEESRLFLNSVVFDPMGDKSFKTLFTANYGFVNSRTAPIYGIANMPSTTLTKTNLNVDQRRGLLTLGSFMAAHADGDDTGTVSRGRYFREEILCSPVPPPDPRDAVFDPAKITPDMTNRERLAAHTAEKMSTCFVCHQNFDGLGFAMENYDPIGRFRLTDKNKPIDPTGTVPLPSGPTLTFKNFVDLLDQLAKTDDLYRCFSSQYLSYTSGRAIASINDCEKKLVFDEFTKSGYKVDTLVSSVVSSPSFTARKN